MSSATIRRLAAVLGTGVLGLLFVCAPAMAGPGTGQGSSSNGSTQGASQSNPDGGGVDKPYAAAGQEAQSQGSSDWDGNNGCGNDDDREDDNNGWCGRKPDHEGDVAAKEAHAKAAEVKAAEVKAAEVKAAEVKAAEATLAARGVPTEVLGAHVEAAAPAATTAAAPTAAAAAAESARPTEVLGVQATRGETLAATGSPVVALMLAGLALVLGGAGLRRLARPRLQG